jgi:hypothetical protein
MAERFREVHIAPCAQALEGGAVTIDEAFDTEFEARLRATLAEMIPKLVASAIVVGEQGLQAPVDVIVARRATSVRRPRRMVAAVLAVAATLLGLTVIAERYTDRTTPSSPATDDAPPLWYDAIAPLLPERFPYVALTFANDVQLWFVAISPTDGKALEIQLASGGYSAGPTTSVDATGEWNATAQGWSVRTPGGLFVSVSCDIGVGGRDYVGPENYCDRTSGNVAFSMAEIRAVANTLATSLTLSIFDQKLGSPHGDTIDTAAASARILEAVPGQQISATDLGNGADHIYNAGNDNRPPSSSDTLAPLDAIPLRADTSVRILHGVYPTSVVTEEPAAALYDDAAVVWMLGSSGVVVRISTTDPSPESVTRLEQLARDLMKLDPTATKLASTSTTYTAQATTTTSESASAIDAETSSTSSTIPSCGQSTSPPTVLVANASHVIGTAKWWRDELAANVPSVDFAEPVNALAQESSSRVLAMSGYECEASLVAGFTAVAAVEPATFESLQSLVAEPLPVGTSIIVLVGDDNMSRFTTGVTTTING